METVSDRKVLRYILINLLKDNKEGLTTSQVYKIIGNEYQLRREWYLYRPLSDGFEDLKKYGINDWREVNQEWLKSEISTEPQWHHILRWSREQIKADGYLDVTAPRGLWRLNEKGLNLQFQVGIEDFSPEEMTIIRSKRSTQHFFTTSLAVDIGTPNPEIVESITYRILRDTSLARSLKNLYNNQCQICGLKIDLNGKEYSEAHHLKPLGSPHFGPDISRNIIVLCPNHHVMLDYGAMKLDISKIIFHSKHNIGEEYINYHNNHVAESSNY